MKLMTPEIAATLPKLGATSDLPAEETKVPLKLFAPVGAATWYATEFDGKDRFFGYADLGFGSPELGYFLLSELESISLPFGLSIERDLYWKPETTLAEVMKGGV